MRAVIQRVFCAKVVVDEKISGEINRGIVALIGFSPKDLDEDLKYILEKIINLRIFPDDNDKMNLSLRDIKGELLIVPNFTLYGDARKGRRPGFSFAAPPDMAEKLFDKFTEMAENLSIKTQKGVFQADMKLSLVNEGPVTLILDSSRIF